jgi:flavorubredoxin
MGKALVVYASRSKSTKRIGEKIIIGLRSEGCGADIIEANKIKKEGDLEGYDAYVFGSATYHGEMMQDMKTLLFLAEKAGLEGKVGGAFGSCGWSCEASDRIFNTMKHIFKMDMVSGSLKLNPASIEGSVPAAEDYGIKIGKKLSSS